MRTKYVEVEVDLSDFDDDDIADEYESRGLAECRPQQEQVEELFYAFKLGKTDRALELARQIAQDAMGRIL